MDKALLSTRVMRWIRKPVCSFIGKPLEIKVEIKREAGVVSDYVCGRRLIRSAGDVFRMSGIKIMIFTNLVDISAFFLLFKSQSR